MNESVTRLADFSRDCQKQMQDAQEEVKRISIQNEQFKAEKEELNQKLQKISTVAQQIKQQLDV